MPHKTDLLKLLSNNLAIKIHTDNTNDSPLSQHKVSSCYYRFQYPNTLRKANTQKQKPPIDQITVLIHKA